MSAHFVVKALKLLHIAIMVFLVLGWLLPAPWLPFHMLFLIATVVHWQFNQGKCIITDWEASVSHSMPIEHSTKDTEPSQGQFTRGLFKKILGREPSDQFLFLFIYSVLITSFIISCVRYWLF